MFEVVEVVCRDGLIVCLWLMCCRVDEKFCCDGEIRFEYDEIKFNVMEVRIFERKLSLGFKMLW